MIALKFRYVNWRGDDHEYVIIPSHRGVKSPPGFHASPTSMSHDTNHLMLSGDVVTRDGDPRPDMDATGRRRSFVIVNMREIEEVEI
jgi:hypothetical protein